MNAIVIEHVKVSDLPEAWREKLPANDEARVTVRIETETTPAKECRCNCSMTKRKPGRHRQTCLHFGTIEWMSDQPAKSFGVLPKAERVRPHT
jgi:hypothetical protein